MERVKGAHDPVLSVDACQLSGYILGSIWRSVIHDDDFEIQRTFAREEEDERADRANGEGDVSSTRPLASFFVPLLPSVLEGLTFLRTL